MKNRTALRIALFCAVAGYATIVCALVFSRDNKLKYQAHQQAPATSAVPANAAGLSPTIENLAEVPAPAPEAAAPEAPASKTLKAN